MLNETIAEQRLQQAMHWARLGRLREAEQQLQSLVFDLARIAALRSQRAAAFEWLLMTLHALKRWDRLAKVFRQYAGEFAESVDPEFDACYAAGLAATQTEPLPFGRRERFRNLLRAFEPTLALDGMVAECGCFMGLSSYLLCSCIKRHDPAFDGAGYRIFDSFRGLSEPGAEDRAMADAEQVARVAPNMVAGKFEAPLALVKKSLAQFPRIEFFPGWIPEAFPHSATDRYRFVHVDVDLYQPTQASFEYFWPRLVSGGVMVCDDYNWHGAKQAVDEFCTANALSCETTLTSQAIIRKAV